LAKDAGFDKALKKKELAAWVSFKEVSANFLGNKKASNYRQIISKMIKNYHAINCNMSIKMHFLHSHLNFFPDNLGAVSDEHGERFHQDICVMEQRYQGNWGPSMMGDYIWQLNRETPDVHKKKAKYNK
jgi:hypothetical protein